MLSILRTDAGLVSQVLAGKSNKFDDLMRRHFNTVYGIAFSYTRNHADAEDLSQEAFIKAYRSLDSLQDTKKFGHWMCVITRNLARTWFARRKREAEVMEQNKAAVHEKTEAVYDDMREVLEQQIKEMDPIPREVLMLHYFSGQSTAEIAKVMGVSQTAILKRLQRAREALGVKLIHELKIIPPAQYDAKQHRRTIMKSITASGIAWKMGGGSWSSAAASTLLSGKALLAAVIVTAVVATAVMVNQNPEPPNNASPLSVFIFPVEDEGYSVEEIIVESDENLNGESKGSGMVDSSDTTLALAAAPPSEEITSVTADSEESKEIADAPESLKGDWNVSFGVEAESAEYMEVVGVTQLVRVGNDLNVNSIKEVGEITLKGDILGREVRLNVFADEVEIGQLRGEFTADFDSLAVSGKVDINENGELDTMVYVRFEKLSDDELKAADALKMAQMKLALIHQAVQRYIGEEKKGLKNLADLHPKYIEDKALIERQPKERLSYMSMTLADMEFKPDYRLAEMENWKNFIETKEPGFLIDLENDLDAMWGSNFPGGHILLRLENTQYNFILTATKEGRIIEVEIESEDDSTDTQKIPDAKQAGIRASCQNNMKQLGLVLKMFEHESPGKYIPGGFRQVYPEYLSDLNILICPGLTNGKVGYEMLFPASRDGLWRELYEKVEGLSAEGHEYMGKVPLIIEKEDCTNTGGRNVLFADGHVEFIKEENWEARMGPYLEYAYK